MIGFAIMAGVLALGICQPSALLSGAIWRRLPTGAETSSVLGQRLHMPEGRFILFCQALPDGRFSRCLFQGEGRLTIYADRAPRLARFMAIEPFTKSGEPVAGRWVRVPITLRTKDDEVDPSAPPPVSAVAPLRPD